MRYWNSYVSVTQIGGQGNFKDNELGIYINVDTDLITSKLATLEAYQWSLMAPKPPLDSFDALAVRGKRCLKMPEIVLHVIAVLYTLMLMCAYMILLRWALTTHLPNVAKQVNSVRHH